MIKCLVWTLKSSLDISVLGCQGAGSHDFPQVDQGKTDSEEDDKLVLRYRPQADLYCCIFEVLSILDIKLYPRLILCIHLSLQIPVFYPTVRAIGPQQSRWRCFSCTMQLQPTTKPWLKQKMREDKDASLWPWRPVGLTVCHRQASLSPTGANL